MDELTLIKQQANMVIKAVEQMEEIKDEVYQMRDSFQKDIDEIRSTYPLNRGEALLLSNAIKNKAHELTTEYFGKRVSKELFGKKRVHISMGLGHQLKKAFNAITYNTIRHLDYDNAKTFVSEFTLEDLPSHYLDLTEKQYEVSLNNNDNLPKDFRGNHRKQMRLQIQEIKHASEETQSRKSITY